MIVSQAAAQTTWTTWFAHPFRVFFFACGAFAVIAVAVWLATLQGLGLPNGLPPMRWHAHEMLFGFAVAAMAGFLLTAVPNWTGVPALHGRPLSLLALVWLSGRLAMLVHPAGGWFGIVCSAVTLAFLPLVAAWVIRALVRSRNSRNAGVAVVLVVMSAIQFGMHLGLLGVWPMGAGQLTVILMLDTFSVLIAVIAGRITPSFGNNWLRGQGQAPVAGSPPWLDVTAISSLAVLLLMDAVEWPFGAHAAAVVAAVANGARLLSWQGWRVRGEPLLWVLHAGYAWLVLGLAVRVWLGIGPAWFHALGIGAMGTLIMGVMTRAALGHSGRPLNLPDGIAVAYVLVLGGAVVRLAAVWWPAAANMLWLVAGGLWLVAWLLFVVRYAPILGRPRADGRPG